MSLRLRLVLYLGCVLAVALGLGCVLAGWHANGAIRADMRAASAAGLKDVVNGIAEASNFAPANRALAELVASFNGNRHLRVQLVAPDGTVMAQSYPQQPTRPVPAWFGRAIMPSLDPASLTIPYGGAAITLYADPSNEIAEVWEQAEDAARTLALFFVLTAGLLYWAIGQGLRPLQRLSAGFSRIGAGDYATRVDRAGPAELASLAVGFNRMAEQLGTMAAQNRRLQEQLLTLQEEERAELARDLHDEIGPFLFAAGVDAACIPALIETGQSDEAAERGVALQVSVAHMKRHIRLILGRLRPLSFGAVGLADSITNLVSFWRDRHPDIAFSLGIACDDATLADATRATLCRVVQESLCNAIRHGGPAHVDIRITSDGCDITVEITDDGIGPGTAGVTPGFGLQGMQERVRAQSGTLAIAGRADGPGLSVIARLPCEAVA